MGVFFPKSAKISCAARRCAPVGAKGSAFQKKGTGPPGAWARPCVRPPVRAAAAGPAVAPEAPRRSAAAAQPARPAGSGESESSARPRPCRTRRYFFDQRGGQRFFDIRCGGKCSTHTRGQVRAAHALCLRIHRHQWRGAAALYRQHYGIHHLRAVNVPPTLPKNRYSRPTSSF